jgi:hypothetical protein
LARTLPRSVTVHQLVGILRLGRGEGVVHGVPATTFLVLLQQREIDHPQGLEDLRVHQAHAAAHFAGAVR